MKVEDMIAELSKLPHGTEIKVSWSRTVSPIAEPRLVEATCFDGEPVAVITCEASVFHEDEDEGG